MSRLATLLLSAIILLSYGPGAAVGAQPRGGHFQEGIVLASSEEGLEQGAGSTSFNLLDLRDLWIRVGVSRMPQTSLLRLTFTSPRGEVFYETSVLYTRDSRATEVHRKGAPHSTTAFPVKRLPGGFALDQPIPISTGAFTRYPRPGLWLVRATLEGHEQVLEARMNLSVAP